MATFAALGALAAGSSIGCDSAQAAFDCQQACEHQRDCYGSSYDVGGCEERCQTNAANDPSARQDADTCTVSDDLKIVDTKVRAPIRFEVPFDHIPDFLTVDQTGRPEDSFQYYIAYDPTQHADSGTVQGAIVRGDEIHVATALRIRNALPASTDPTSGGWGTVRATVPFEMRFNRDGSAVLSFVASWSDLGISGPFSWVLDTFHFGAGVRSLNGVFSER
ncbi:MAG TPA: hypothetical protein VLA79_16535 [Polyangia bacterium]|nr:hypothetical protein [Polyangia bacterium]